MRFLRGGCGSGCLCGKLCEPCRKGGDCEPQEGTVLRVTPERVVLRDGRVFPRPGGAAYRPGQRVIIDCRPGLTGQTPMQLPRSIPLLDEPFVPPPYPEDPLPLPTPPLAIRWLRPHAPLLPDVDHLMSVPGYPKETGEGFRPDWPIVGKLHTIPEVKLDQVQLNGFEYEPRIDHFALRWRDGALQPYAAGMADGKRYIRVADVPVIVGSFFMRRDAGRWVPFEDGTGWAIPTPQMLQMYLENTVLNADVKVYQGHGDQLTIFGGKWWLDGDHAFPMFGLQEDVLHLGELPFRQACQATLESVQIGVKRFYEDGTVEEEEPLPGFDLTIYPPSFPGASTPVDTWWSIWQEWVAGSEGNINSGYKLGTTTVDLENTTWQEVAGKNWYGWEPGLTTSFSSGPKDGHPKDLAIAISGSGISPTSFTANPDEWQPPILADGTLPGRFPVKMRYPADKNGDPATWETPDDADFPPYVQLGRLIYQGELGELPAPRSGIMRVWCDISVNGAGDFTADCWIDGKVRYAVVVYASGNVAGSIKRGDKPAKLWYSTLSELWPDAPEMTRYTPVMTYSFMVKGWPFAAGSLAWARYSGGGDALARIINANVRRDVGSKRVRLLLARRENNDVNVPDFSRWYRQNLLPVDRYLKPVFAGELNLERLISPGPAEKDFKRVQLVSAEGPVQLTFTPPEGEYPEDQTIRKRLSELEFVMPLNQATEFTPPDGWQKQLSRKLGKHHVIVQLTIPDEQQTETTITLTFPPKSRFGHPRARLRLTQQEA